MNIELRVCEECGAYYAEEKYNVCYSEYGHETWHREQLALLDELKALIKGENNGKNS